MTDYQNGDIGMSLNDDGNLEIGQYSGQGFERKVTILSAKTVQVVGNLIPETAKPTALIQAVSSMVLMDTTNNVVKWNGSGLTGGKGVCNNNVLTPEHFTISLKFFSSAQLGSNFYPLIGAPVEGFAVKVDGANHLSVVNKDNQVASYALSDFGINLLDGNFHDLAVIGRGGASGLVILAVDGKVLTPDLQPWNIYWQTLVFRGANEAADEVNAPGDLLAIREVALFNFAKYWEDYQPEAVTNAKDAIGYYLLTHDVATSRPSTTNQRNTGFKVVPQKPYGGFDTLYPWSKGSSGVKFTTEGLTGGLLFFGASKDLEDFTCECEFKVATTPALVSDLSLIGSLSLFDAGIEAATGEFVVHDSRNNEKVTYKSGVLVNDGEWHRFALTCQAGFIAVYLDGNLVCKDMALKVDFSRLFFRGIAPDGEIAPDESLTIKNITVSAYCKYYGAYNPNLTPQMPSVGALGFYPLVNGVYTNRVKAQSGVEFTFHSGDSFEYLILDQNSYPDTTLAEPWFKLAGDSVFSQTLRFNGHSLFVRNVVGNPLMRGIE
ncbi:hypothetical protein JGUZn3_10900 [Entomobacter blattae]|uniref:Laminin G domain-containing protein n=2 Tax=Entomobacter blattae TaxID=2762277 RepID=A0A7H1NRA8_9PROT|nr:hypothetical protein JGUZn3_10900 [Entomobacter blattae]